MFSVVPETENTGMSLEHAPDRGASIVAMSNLDIPIWGVRAIAAAANLTPRQTYHALERGYLPASKAGRKWVTTSRRLQTLFTGKMGAVSTTG
jgi:hypothetical protein